MRLAAASLCTSAAAAAPLASPLLPTRPLPYRGVLLDMTLPNATADNFAERLAPSLERWRTEGMKSVMMKIPIERAALAAEAAEHGFTFHHVPLTSSGRHVVLKHWLQADLTDKVPPLATHQVGIAGLCIDADNRILLVKEWRDVAGGGREPSRQWKMPGGLLDAGETFAEAACRETREETGVETEFKSLLCFWHRHGLTWGQSDLYYVARLAPKSDAQEICVDPDEISACKWMHVDEFLETQDHPLITAVLRRTYGLEAPGNDGPAMPDAPLVEMLEAPVQWPGREPYPTYFAATSTTTDP